MNYYERYCGDYQRNAAYLSLAEHGVYTMLFDTYFSVEKLLPEELSSLYKVCRVMTRLEQHAVKVVADQLFPVSAIGGLCRTHRADHEIVETQPKIKAARINYRKGSCLLKESFQQTWSATRSIPDGLSTASGNITAAILTGKPGGKAHLCQPHQNRDCGSTRTICSPEEHVCASVSPSGVACPVISEAHTSQIQSFEVEIQNSVSLGVAGG